MGAGGAEAGDDGPPRRIARRRGVTSQLGSLLDPIADKILGMSAPAKLWGQRISEVGACGVEARRIFGDLTSSGDSTSSTMRLNEVRSGRARRP